MQKEPLLVYAILSDFGSVAWRMGRLGMDLEPRAMTTLLDKRVAGMKKNELRESTFAAAY